MPVQAMVNAAGSDEAFHRDVYLLVEDHVNQGGITNLHIINEPAFEEGNQGRPHGERSDDMAQRS